MKSWGFLAIGKEIFTIQVNIAANMIRKAILGEEIAMTLRRMFRSDLRFSAPGCPHRSTFYVLNKLKMHAAEISDVIPSEQLHFSVVDTTICMGASILQSMEMEKAKGRDYMKNWVAVIGDSTFLHTGVNSLMNMVYNQATGTVLILDNSTTGMTGHQDHAATGKTFGETDICYRYSGTVQSYRGRKCAGH